MNRSFLASALLAGFVFTACAVESSEPTEPTEPESQPVAAEQDLGMSLELRREVNASFKEEAPPSTNASCGSYGNWSSNGSRWCGGTGLGCLFQGSVGIYTRESRAKLCCAPGVSCWYEYEYRDTLLQCGC